MTVSMTSLLGMCVTRRCAYYITEDACYMPSGAIIFLRWGMRDVNRICGYKSWRLDILQKTRDNIRSNFDDKNCKLTTVSDDDGEMWDDDAMC